MANTDKNTTQAVTFSIKGLASARQAVAVIVAVKRQISAWVKAGIVTVDKLPKDAQSHLAKADAADRAEFEKMFKRAITAAGRTITVTVAQDKVTATLNKFIGKKLTPELVATMLAEITAK